MARGLDPRAGYNMGSIGGQLISAIMQNQNDRKRAEKVAKFDAAYPDFVANLDPNMDPFRFQAELVKFANQYGISRGPELKEREALYAQVWSARQEALAKTDKSALTPEAIARRESIVAPYAKKAGEEVAFSETDPTSAETAVPYGAQTRRDVNGQTVAGPLADTLDEASMTMQEIFDMAQDEGMRTGEVGKEARERVKTLQGENKERSEGWRKLFGEEEKGRDKLATEAAEFEALAAAAEAKGHPEIAKYWRAGGRVKEAPILQSLGLLPKTEKTAEEKAASAVGKVRADQAAGIINQKEADDAIEAINRGDTFMAEQYAAQARMQAGTEERKAVGELLDKYDEEGAKVERTATGIKALVETAEPLIGKGFSGAAADWRLNFAKGLQLFGVGDPSMADRIANTEQLQSVLAENLLANKEKLPGVLSDSDIQLLRDIAGGTKLEPESLRRILRKVKNFADDSVRIFNRRVERGSARFDDRYKKQFDVYKVNVGSGIRVLGYE